MGETEFDIPSLNRAQRRSMGNRRPMPASSLKITRYGDKVAVGIEQPGHVELTQVEAVQLANALLRVAGEPDEDA